MSFIWNALFGEDEYQDWSKIVFKKGDVLECKLNNPLLMGKARHVILATSDRDVIHVAGVESTKSGKILEEPWKDYHKREQDHNPCRVAKEYDLKFTVDKAVERARK